MEFRGLLSELFDDVNGKEW